MVSTAAISLRQGMKVHCVVLQTVHVVANRRSGSEVCRNHRWRRDTDHHGKVSRDTHVGTQLLWLDLMEQGTGAPEMVRNSHLTGGVNTASVTAASQSRDQHELGSRRSCSQKAPTTTRPSLSTSNVEHAAIDNETMRAEVSYHVTWTVNINGCLYR